MKPVSRHIILATTLIILGILVYFFSFLVYYVAIAGVISLLGRPAEVWIRTRRLGRHRIPSWVSAGVTLLGMVCLLALFVFGFVVFVVKQAGIIAAIDFNALDATLHPFLSRLEAGLQDYGLLSAGQDIKTILMDKAREFIGFASFSGLVGNVAGFTGALLTGMFSVVFLSFFFLRDRHLLSKGLLVFVPFEYEQRAIDTMEMTKNLLTRYFSGLVLEVCSMILLLSLGLWIAGIPNALLIGFIGGMLNIIPYVGPLIGAVTGIILTSIAGASANDLGMIPWSAFWVALVFVLANLADNLLLQPLIYSRSVKAHPIEIFLVILMAGSMAGITGMMVAIPAYTLIRIVGKEFFGSFDLMKKLTQSL